MYMHGIYIPHWCIHTCAVPAMNYGKSNALLMLDPQSEGITIPGKRLVCGHFTIYRGTFLLCTKDIASLCVYV